MMVTDTASPATTTAPASRPTWTDLTLAEPRLAALLAEIKRVRATGPRFCANSRWYGYADPAHGFKARMCCLVGWERREGPALLRTRQAYDVAYETLYAGLPDCRGCLCL
jgi:hypothetical protein